MLFPVRPEYLESDEIESDAERLVHLLLAGDEPVSADEHLLGWMELAPQRRVLPARSGPGRS